MPRFLALVVALLAGTGCTHHKVFGQSVGDVRSTRELAPVHATAIHFAFQNPGWESATEWADHVSAWTEAYLAGLMKAGKDLGPRRPQILPPGAPAYGGLVVAATIRDIQRGSFMTPDKLIADVAVFEAATRRPLLTATLEVDSNRIAGPEAYTFGGRIKFACLNLADAIVEALRVGQFPD